jgi:hypothetical protein
VSEQLAGTPASILGTEPSLLTIIALLLLWVSGGFKRLIAEAFAPSVPARPPSIRLGVPCLVPMSDGEAADAAHLLGSSVAALVAADWDN